MVPELDTDLIASNPETVPSFAASWPLPKTRPSMLPVPLPRIARSAVPVMVPRPSKRVRDALSRFMPLIEADPSNRMVAGYSFPSNRRSPP